MPKKRAASGSEYAVTRAVYAGARATGAGVHAFFRDAYGNLRAPGASGRLEVEAFVALVPAPDFKSGGSRGDTASAGSIPVRFRQNSFADAGILS